MENVEKLVLVVQQELLELLAHRVKLDQLVHQVHLDHEERLGLKDFKVIVDQLDLQVHQGLLDQVDKEVPLVLEERQDPVEKMERMVLQVHLVLVVKVDHQDLGVRLDLQGPQGLLAHEESLVQEDKMAHLEQLDLLDPEVRLGLLDPLVHQGLQVLWAQLGREVKQVPEVLLDQVENLHQEEKLVNKGPPVHLESLVHLDLQDLEDPLVKTDSLVSLAVPVLLDLVARLVKLDQAVKQGLQDLQGQEVQGEKLVLRVNLDLEDQLDQQVLVDPLAQVVVLVLVEK